MRFVGNTRSTHTASHDIKQHVFSSYGRIIGFSHEFADKVQSLLRHGKACASCVYGYLSDSFQYFVSISADIQLLSVLKVAVVMLESLFCSVDYRVIDIFQCKL